MTVPFDTIPEIHPDTLGETPVFSPRDMIEYRLKRVKRTALNLPERCIMGFFPEMTGRLKQSLHARIEPSVNRLWPYALFQWGDKPMAYLTPGMGAPVAAALLEESITLGIKSCLFFGMAGDLTWDPENPALIIPERAIRGEGTSRYYLSPEEEARPDPQMTLELMDFFNTRNIPVKTGAVWTTDAVYRETPGLIRQRREQGCIAVDMEAAALFAVAEFHQIKISAFFIPFDSVTEETWHPILPNLPKIWKNPYYFFSCGADFLAQFSNSPPKMT